MYFTLVNCISRSRMHDVLIFIWRSIDDGPAFFVPYKKVGREKSVTQWRRRRRRNKPPSTNRTAAPKSRHPRPVAVTESITSWWLSGQTDDQPCAAPAANLSSPCSMPRLLCFVVNSRICCTQLRNYWLRNAEGGSPAGLAGPKLLCSFFRRTKTQNLVSPDVVSEAP